MRNKIIEVFDTSISKIAISVSDKKYQEFLDHWSKCSGGSSREAIAKLPRTMKDAILGIIPKIKEIKFEDMREKKDAHGDASFICNIDFITDPILGFGEGMNMKWFGILNDYVYANKRVKSLSEDELKMLSLSFCLETLALIPCYIGDALGDGTIIGQNRLQSTWYRMYKECYPALYKHIFVSHDPSNVADVKLQENEDIKNAANSMLKIPEWDKSPNRAPTTETIYEDENMAIKKVVITNSNIKGDKSDSPKLDKKTVEKLRNVENRIKENEKKIQKNLKYIPVFNWFIIIGETLALGFGVYFLNTLSLVPLGIAFFGLVFAFLAFKAKAGIQIENILITIECRTYREDMSDEMLRYSIGLFRQNR